jgi:hypothetical protein
MYCIFKAQGYTQKNHACLRCSPLEQIFSSVGYEEKEAFHYSRNILRAFRGIKLDDSFRDEKFSRKIVAKASSILLNIRTPKKIRNEIRNVNSAIIELENSRIDAPTYLKEVSSLGRSIFESLATSNSKRLLLGTIGSKLAGAIVVEDMKRDLQKDIEKERFNPFKDSGSDFNNNLYKKYIGDFRALMDTILTEKKIIVEKIGLFKRMRMKFLRTIINSSEEEDCCDTAEDEGCCF